MNKTTYKELESLVNILGYNVRYDWHVYIQDNTERTIASVSTTHYKQLNLHWSRFEELPDVEKDLIGNACWALASTPLEDREGSKYYLKVSTTIMPGAPETESYLCVKRDRSGWMILDKFEDEDYQTKFTDKEIKELEEVLDLTLFERVEVEDD